MILNQLHKLSDEEYFSAKGVNASSLKEFAKSPAHYKAYLDAPSKSSKAFNVGTLTHNLILEGKTNWAVVEGDRRKKDVKENIQALESLGKIIIKPGEDTDILAMKESVKNHSLGRYLGIDPKCSELAGFAEDEETGLMLKAKFDYAPSSGNVLFDLKTTISADPKRFKWSMKDYGYDIQAVHYLHVANLCGMKYDQFIFIAVEKTAPYGVCAYVLDDETRERAENKYRLLLEKYKECKDSGDFSFCYPTDIQEVNF